MIPITEYWHAVAKTIDAEDEKLSLFVPHSGELGRAREAILRHFLLAHTPDPFRVETGFICRFSGQVGSLEPSYRWTSRQCDLLVYNPQISRPYYSFENLVVVPHQAAKSVVEVKTHLVEREFQQMVDLWEELHWLGEINVMGFAFEGWTFDTFIERLKEAIRDRRYGVANCIAVHRKNYIFIRSEYALAPPSPERHRPARYQFAVNFDAAEKKQSLSSGCFLDTFLRQLPAAGGYRALSIETYLPHWFNQLPLPPEAKLVITDDGNVSHGLLVTE
jgi:hypothetical protein